MSLDPGLSIRLTEPNRGYRPGQTLFGHVLHRNAGNIAQRSVAVTLTLHGLAKTKITSHKKYDSGTQRERLPLVHTTITLQPSSPMSSDTNTVTYLFAIPIPEKAQPGPGEIDALVASDPGYWAWYPSQNNSENGVFAEAAGGSLPPTLRLGPRGSYIRSEGFVEYKLIATLSHVFDDRGASKMEPFKHAECGFWMVGAPDEPDYPECKIDGVYYFSFNTWRLDPRIGMHGELTWKQRMSPLASNIPAAIFCCNAWSDSLIDIGRYFNVRVSLTLPGPYFERPAEPKNQVTVDANLVDFESVRIQLKQEIRLRAGRYLDRWWNCPWEHTFTSADIANTLTFSRTDKGEPIWQMRCGPVPRGTIPTTKTGNISYTYTLNVKMRSRCAGNDRTTEVNLFPICRYARAKEMLVPQKIRRKPVGGRTISLESQTTMNSVQSVDEVDELADMGPYNTDADEIPGTVKALDTVLRSLNYAGKVGHIAHGVVGAAGMIF